MKVIDNYKDTCLMHYRIYYGRKKFYDTGPQTNKLERLSLTNLSLLELARDKHSIML
jgi:hypothetical protein